MMYQTGEIIYFDHLVFADKKVDNKKRRPCIVLFSELDETDQCKIYFCPLTTSLRTFNRHPHDHLTLTSPIFSKKVSFAKLNNVMTCYEDKNIHRTEIILKKDGLLVVKRIAREYQNNRYHNSQEIKEVLEHFNHSLCLEHVNQGKPYIIH